MNDEDLIGYLLGALETDEQQAVAARLRANPEAASRLEQLRQAFAPLEADREPVSPPPGLASRTLARLAAHLEQMEPAPVRAAIDQPLPAFSTTEQHTEAAVPLRPAPREAPEIRLIGGHFRLDFVVAGAVAFVAFGLLMAGISKVRMQNQLLACQANLQTMYLGLEGYADTHDGRYPRIEPNTPASSFATTLADAGQVPVGFQPSCPACVPESTESQTPARYTYSLGFQSPTGELLGLQRAKDRASEHDLVPISADYPTPAASPGGGPLCPHQAGMNVLFVGGNVRTTTSPLVGPNGDDIYRNALGHVAAGVSPLDVVLGRPADRP
jgi:prepilin-type processing-associated H-X9-DG protein